jgi:hypothetical protein
MLNICFVVFNIKHLAMLQLECEEIEIRIC